MPTPDAPQDVYDALRSELSTFTTEAVASQLRDLDLRSTREIVDVINAEDRRVPDAVSLVLPNIVTAIDAIAERMAKGGRLIYVGAGTPGRLGVLDASECPPTFNTTPEQVIGVIAGGDTAIRNAVEAKEDDPLAGRDDLVVLNVGPLDSVVGISASGRTPYVAGALAHAREAGALTVAIASNASSHIGSIADHAIEVVVGPEVIAGSTRLKSGTAQKLVLNMISTVVMVRLGKTYGNIMVDLRATNQKLRARAQRAVMLVTGADAATALATLDKTDGSVKTAILVINGGVSPTAARSALAEYGNLREALASFA